MKPILKNIVAVILGWCVGSAINMGLITLGHSLFPLENIDPNDMEAYAEVLPGLDFKYFIFPFLAHGLGTLAGAMIAGWMAANHKMKLSLLVGGLFLLGGIAINFILPGPTWFTLADILLAYIPMAWIGGKIALKLSKQ